MLTRTILSIGVATLLSSISAQAQASLAIHNQALEIVGAGAVADPLIAVEASRNAIIERLVAEHAHALATNSVNMNAFRAALAALRADQLLAASLVNTLEEVTAIVSSEAQSGGVLQRFVAMTPVVATSMNELPIAQAYLVRRADTLVIVKASALALGDASTQVVGYFLPATITSVTTVVEKPSVKDDPGTGANSWIGYSAGGNQASGTGSAVAAGTNNVASGQNSFVGAGTFNAATAQGAFVGGGTSNVAAGISSLVIGGFDNQATVIDATVVAGAGNRATGARSVVVGGGYNLASGQWSFVGGGGRQTANSGGAGTFVEDNVAAGNFSTIGGGQGNRVGPNGYATISGGQNNNASGNYSTIGGGDGNGASNFYSTVGGGNGNHATGNASTVGGGEGNNASASHSTITGGQNNTVTGVIATVAGGSTNTASGLISFAAGFRANADAARCAVFSFWSSDFPGMSCFGPNVFRVAADHGFSIDYYSRRSDGGGNRWVQISDLVANVTIATWTGAYLSDTGIWANNSDVKRKTDFQRIDARQVLAGVVKLPITRWRYIADSTDKRHIGPMAQDFWTAFGLGDDDTHIGTLDESGVALAAIQGLDQKLDQELKEKDAKIGRLEGELAVIKRKLGLD